MTPDEEHLCVDTYIGRDRRRYFSLDVTLVHRHTKHWGGKVFCYFDGKRCQFRGPFRELYIQTRVRPWLRRRNPTDFLNGVPAVDTPTWESAPGVARVDLDRLGELADSFRSRLVTVDGDETSAINEVTFMPSHIEKEIRTLAHDLTQGGPGV